MQSHQLRWTGSDRSWIMLLAGAFVLVLLINPLGYIGGGWDDWQYLMASRCWAEHGACIPRTHWEGRWPVFAPTAAIFSLLGESRTTLGLWPMAASIAALVMIVLVGNRLAGRPSGWLAALLFLFTPAFAIQILSPSVEALELTLILAAVLCILHWRQERLVRFFFLAGLAFGFAFQVRETSLIAVGLAGLFVVTQRPRLADIAAAAAGFLAPLAAEFIIYWLTTGDPLFRRNLSLGHTKIPSSELLAAVDPNASPMFNPDYIANWRHEPGVRLHWLVDGFVNLFVNAKAGISLMLVGVLLLQFGKQLDTARRGMALRLYGFAIFYAAILIYALAIDPKARMMFVPLSASCLVLAMLVTDLWRTGRRLLPAVAVGMHMLAGSSILFVHQRTDIIEGPAARWMAQYPGEIEIDPNTRRHLALVPGIDALSPLGSNASFLIYNSVVRCGQWLQRADLPPRAIEVVHEQPISNAGRISGTAGGALCLFRYEVPIAADTIRSVIRRSRLDGRYIMNSRTYLGADKK